MPRSKLKSDSRVAKMAPTEPFLPTELMIEVLEVYIGSLPSRSLRKERRNLYLVCRLWRQIVDSTPSMWDRIYLHTNDPPRIPDAHLEAVLGTWIGKAGNLALELESHARSYSWADDHQRILANVLRGSASRWTTLMLNSFNPLDFAVDARTSRQRYPERPSVHWDLLETVHITNASCDVRPITHQIPPPKMPRLRTLTLVSGSHHLAQYSSIFPFKQLHQLTFIKVRTELIGPILQQCTQLEEFTFHFQIHYYHYGGVNTTIGVSPTPVLLKHLHRCKIDGAQGARMLSSIVNPILFPNLEDLRVRFGRAEFQPPNSPSMTILRDKIVNSRSTSLTTISLCNPGGTQEGLLDLLGATPSLRCLDLSQSFPDLDFLEKCNKQKVLPALESIRLETLAYLWPKASRVGANQQDKLNGRDLVKLKHLKTVFNKFTKERGYKAKTDGKFPSSSWSVQLAQAAYIASTTNDAAK